MDNNTDNSGRLSQGYNIRVKIQTKNLLLILSLFVGFLGSAQPVQAQSSDVYDMIAQVNAVRTANGLTALEIDGSLMASAQAHAEYMANSGICSHEGPGGRPKDRAVAYGFGGGATAFVTENIYCGGKSVVDVVTWWQGDDLHLLPYVEGHYRSVGGGVATNTAGQKYFVLEAGYTAGGSGSTSSGTTSGGTTTTFSTQSASQRVSPVITATPQMDGSLVHEVQQGQAFWSIAIAYGIKINDILLANNLTATSVLSIGQKLLIHGPYTATPELPPTETPQPDTPTPTITFTPTITRTPTPTFTPTARPLFEGAQGFQNIDRQDLGIGLVIVCVLGLGFMIIASFRKKKPETPEDYDPLDPPIDSL
jgi:uncharacterized protein YkwD